MADAAAPVQQSFLNWVFMSLGPAYALLLGLAGLLSFILALVIVLRGKGPMAAAALVLIVHVPILLGIFGALGGAINSYTVIAMSPVSPKPSEVASGISTALFGAMFALIMTMPGYAVAAIGAVARSFPAESNQTTQQ